MHIKDEHFQYIKNAILANSKAPTLPSYLAEGLTEERWRWDLFNMSVNPKWVVDNIYPYANDNHLDTVLRKITGGK